MQTPHHKCIKMTPPVRDVTGIIKDGGGR